MLIKISCIRCERQVKGISVSYFSFNVLLVLVLGVLVLCVYKNFCALSRKTEIEILLLLTSKNRKKQEKKITQHHWCLWWWSTSTYSENKQANKQFFCVVLLIIFRSFRSSSESGIILKKNCVFPFHQQKNIEKIKKTSSAESFMMFFSWIIYDFNALMGKFLNFLWSHTTILTTRKKNWKLYENLATTWRRNLLLFCSKNETWWLK